MSYVLSWETPGYPCSILYAGTQELTRQHILRIARDNSIPEIQYKYLHTHTFYMGTFIECVENALSAET